MPRLLPLILVLALAPAAEAAAKRPACPPRGAVVRDGNEHLRMYKRSRTNPALYACHVRTRRTVRLSTEDDGGGGAWTYLQAYAISGPRIVWATQLGDEMNTWTPMRMANLSTGSRRRWDPVPFLKDGVYQDVHDIALTRAGQVVWIATENENFPGTMRVVARMRPGGEPEKLDEGPGIEKGSLALSGTAAYWMHGGTARSAPL